MESADNDLTKNWPEEVKKAYNDLKVPSLYDFILTNEKLSLEVHKQNRSMKTVEDELSKVSKQLDMVVDILSEEMDEMEEEELEERRRIFEAGGEPGTIIDFTDLEIRLLTEKQEAIQENMKNILLNTVDHLLDLSKVMHLKVDRFLELPKAEADRLIPSIASEVDTIRYKLIENLQGLEIQIIEPKAGDLFSVNEHRILEKVSGGVAGTIARTIRVGYIQNNQIIRQAEVAVYV